jgi:tight adherence protein B
MKVLAAACVGLACALLAATLAGNAPRRRIVASRRRIDWPASPRTLVLASGGAGLLTIAGVAAVTGSVFVAVPPAAMVAALPALLFSRRREAQRRWVSAAWPDALRELQASVAAGQSLTQAVTALVVHGPLSLRPAFARFPELSRVLGTPAALQVVKEELADPISDRVIEVLILAHERGGSIVRSVLSDLIETTTKDLKLLDELETESLEMRINARAVIVLPWLVLVALTMRPGPFRDFYRSRAGVVTLLIAAMLSTIGIALLQRFNRRPQEPRVIVDGSAA